MCNCKPNIAVLEGDPLGCITYYRSFMPFLRMPEVNFTLLNTFSWQDLMKHDLFFLGRPRVEPIYNIFKYLKRHNKPVIVDFDDLLTELPNSNPRKPQFIPDYPRILDMIREADDVWMSTQDLIDFHKNGTKDTPPVNRDYVLVPNAWDTEMFPVTEQTPRSKTVVWRGSETHNEDLEEYREAAIKLSNKYPDFRWVFMSHKPDWANNMRNVLHVPTLDPIDFIRTFKSLDPLLMVVPLADHNFNRAKSNCSWLEGTHAGATVIAKDLPEFRRPGVLNYSNPAELERYMEMVMQCRFNGFLPSRRYISENLTVSKVNETRLARIQALLQNKP